MDRIVTYVPNDQVLSADLNTLQDRIDNVRRGSKDTELAAWARSIQAVIAQFAGSGNPVPTASFAALDETIDWRGRLVEGWIATIGGVNDRINGSAEQYVNQYLRTARPFIGFLGTGSSTSFDRATGDYYIEADYEPITPTAANFYLYANTGDGKLRLWNATGTDRRCIIVVRAIGSEP